MRITENSIFKYKTVRGLLHRAPALVKLLSLLPLSVFCMSLSPFFLACGTGAAIITAFACKFTIREQLTDLKPALFYAALMYALSVFSNLHYNWSAGILLPAARFLLPNLEFLRVALRLTLIIQLSALLFRTTSSIEIRDALCKINKRAGESVSLFLSFIPEIFTTWSVVNLAWKARGGKNGFAKIKLTVFTLISLCLEKASQKSKALEARR